MDDGHAIIITALIGAAGTVIAALIQRGHTFRIHRSTPNGSAHGPLVRRSASASALLAAGAVLFFTGCALLGHVALSVLSTVFAWLEAGEFKHPPDLSTIAVEKFLGFGLTSSLVGAFVAVLVLIIARPAQ